MGCVALSVFFSLAILQGDGHHHRLHDASRLNPYCPASPAKKMIFIRPCLGSTTNLDLSSKYRSL